MQVLAFNLGGTTETAHFVLIDRIELCFFMYLSRSIVYIHSLLIGKTKVKTVNIL